MAVLRSKKGFTLIELLIVVVIVGILATVLISRFSGAKDSAYLANINAIAGQVSQAAMAFQANDIDNTEASTVAELQTMASELAAEMGQVNLTNDGTNWIITHDVLDTKYGEDEVQATVNMETGVVTAAALPAAAEE
ncbi:MAG: type II secretion system protein [Candidatus Glassbacteria bacterium]|nr:type II secretion system protein [Candidatus Glassbacteria bacterium]